MTIFYLVRHGNVDRLGDVADPPLTALGNAEAESAAQQLACIAVDHVFASPLRRAQETAALIAKPHALPVIEDPRLRERANFGDLPGQPLEEFIAMWKRCNNERDWQPPVGDSSIGCGQRVEALVTDCYVRWPAATIVAACHGGVIADFLLNVFSQDEIAALNPALAAAPYSGEVMRECSITIATFDAMGYCLKRAASVDHLPSVAD